MIHFFSATFLATNILLLCIPLLITSLISIQLRWRRRERQQMAQGEVERQAYVAEILKIQDAERRRISLELHDDTIQTLIVLANRCQNLELSMASKSDDSSLQIRENTQWIKKGILNVCENLRNLCLDLRPSVLDTMGLAQALMWLTDGIHEETGLKINMTLEGDHRQLPSGVETNLFRIAQEAMTNVKRHAKARSAVISLSFTQDTVELKIQDDGRGFFTKNGKGSFAQRRQVGLIGMQARAASIDATLEIDTQLGHGTSITVLVRC